jgi:hypothetical protein
MSGANRATSSVAAEIDEQKGSNTSAIAHYQAFAAHRAKLTELVLSGVVPEAGGRLCVLGAGNGYDLDVDRLGAAFSEIHLVDLDAAALERAAGRAAPEARAKIVRHAPVDLSGLLDRLERWRSFQVQPQELMDHPARVAKVVAERLPGPFDVVLSACLLSQIQLTVLNVLSDKHRLFEAVRQLVNLAHLRTIASLLVPGGRGLLVTDVATNQDLASVSSGSTGLQLLDELTAAGKIVFAVRPDLLTWAAREDPMLKSTVTASPPLDAWLWHNGPERVFLVYALELRRALVS